MSKDTVATGLQLTVAAIYLVPTLGVYGANALQRLYGQEYDDPTTQLLVHHRAVLFGLLGSLTGAATFSKELRPAADASALISITSFLALERFHSHNNGRIDGVVRADWIALVCQIGSMLLRSS